MSDFALDQQIAELWLQLAGMRNAELHMLLEFGGGSAALERAWDDAQELIVLAIIQFDRAIALVIV